jgi:hypothetical protein
MASIFDTLLAPFSTSAQDAAAQAQQQGLQNAYNQYSGLNQQAIQNLQNYYGLAAGNINQFYPQAQAAISGAVPQQVQALQQGFTGALTPQQQQQAIASQGTTQLLAALGLGPSGAAGMQQTLAATPGYQFAVDQATNAVNRNQAAQGALNSGATNVDLSNYITGLASQNANNYISQLAPFLGMGQNVANNISGLYAGLGSGLSNIYGQQGQLLANLLTGQGGALAGLNTNLGSGVSNALQNQGAAAYGTQAGIGNAQANAALAPLQAGNNLWGLIGNVAKLGTGGGGTLGGNAVNSLFGSFGGGAGGATGGISALPGFG